MSVSQENVFCSRSQATTAFLLARIIERDVKRLWFSAFFKPCRRTADVLGPLLKQQVAGMSILMSGECWGLARELDGFNVWLTVSHAVEFAVLSSSTGSTSPQTPQQREGVCLFLRLSWTSPRSGSRRKLIDDVFLLMFSFGGRSKRGLIIFGKTAEFSDKNP